MPRKHNKRKGLLREEKGAVAIWVAFSLTGLLGFAALAVDLGHFYSLRNEMQNAADAAALAAISQFDADQPDNNKVQVEAVAIAITEENLPSLVHGNVLSTSDVEMGQWDRDTKTFTKDASQPPTAVRVTIRKTTNSGNPAATYFGRVLGFKSVDINAEAIAGLPISPACLVTLDPTEPSLHVNSDSTVQANGCRIQVNSTHAQALSTGTASTISADDINVSGGFSGGGISPTPNTGAPPAADPLAGTPAPAQAADACDFVDVTFTDNLPMTPGVYCGRTELNSGANKVMQPGNYIFRNGDFVVNSGSTVTGQGVLLYFTGTDSPELVLNSGSHARLSAPTSGPHAGLVIYQDPNVEDGTVHLFNSDSGSYFEGTIYLPNGKLMINSGTTIDGPANYTNVMARTVEINSDSGFTLNSDYENSNVPLVAGLTRRKMALVQ